MRFHDKKLVSYELNIYYVTIMRDFTPQLSSFQLRCGK